MKNTKLIIFLFFYISVSSSLHASFYQAETLAQYCLEYKKFNQLDNSADHLKAGVCSGYVASTIDLMHLSARLCGRDHLNLDGVIDRFLEEVGKFDNANNNSAIYYLVDVLQKNYSCE